MVHTQDLEKIMALTLASAHIEGDKPLSLLIVSDRPESGKTDTVNQFYGNAGVAILSDVTAHAFWRDFGEDLAAGRLKHIIIPELLAPLSRGAETVDSLIATLQILIEEGLTEIHTGFLKPIKLAKPVTVGVIGCMPRTAYAQRRLQWLSSGFLSRFIVVTYRYSDHTVERIVESIRKREYMSYGKVDLGLAGLAPVAIDVPESVADKCWQMAEAITAKARKEGKCYGFRELKNLMRMVSANVILERCQQGSDRTEATMADFEEVSRLGYLINEQYNALGDNHSAKDGE